MEMVLYHNASAEEVVYKSLTTLDTVTFRAKRPKDITHPTFEITGAITSDCNYVYIADLERYYFVDDIETLVKGAIRLVLREDYLSSHWSKIKSKKGIISRQESKTDFYLNDSEMPVKTPTRVQTKVFPNGFNNSVKYYITILGAEVTP